MTKYNKQTIIEAIQLFYKLNPGKPRNRDFKNNPAFPSCDTIVNHFGSFNTALEAAGITPNKTPTNKFINFSKQGVIDAIKQFYVLNGNIPTTRDFTNNPDYPVSSTVKHILGSWNAAVEAAGFNPNTQNGFGIDTYGKDGYLYRSRSEAYFADNFLYQKYEYLIEPKYPEPYNRYYDWYIPSLDLYIELDGGIRPKVINEKKDINNTLVRTCLFIPTDTIYNKLSILDFIKK